MSERESREARMAEERAASAVLDVLLERMMFRNAADYSEGWAIGVIAAGMRDHSALLPVAPVVGEREALMGLAWEILDEVDYYMSIDGLDREELEELQTVIAGRIAGALAARTPEEER